MAAEGEEEVVPPLVPELDSIRLSAEQRANIVIRLLNEISVVNAAENAHDLNLFYLNFAQQTLADLHRHVPALASVKKDLIHGSLFFGLAASTGSTRAAAQQNRVIDAINGLGPDFLRGLGRYRVSQAPLVEDPDKYVALLNFFQFGHQIFQHSILHTAALLRMTDEYLKIYPEINKITDFNNRLIMSDITKAEGYTFGKNCQSDINALGEASKKFYELVLPVFEVFSLIQSSYT